MEARAAWDCVKRRERSAIVPPRVVLFDGLTDVDGVEMLIREVPSTTSVIVGMSLLIRAMIAGKAVEDTSTPVAAYHTRSPKR